ncbi:MAG TPA: GntR family transcriptional regulator [Microbacteriaceae bacterium]|nr:GntR family transcriptional regulator [Microbacteriaceae bacterium]
MSHGTFDRNSYLAVKREERSDRHNSPRRVYALLRSALRRGYFWEGNHLFEQDLMAQLSATRRAVREALGMLARDGILSRHSGEGTRVERWVTSVPLGYPSSLYEANPLHKATIKELDRRQIEAPEFVTSLLQLPPESPVVLREHVVLLDGEPGSVHFTYYGAHLDRSPEETPPLALDDNAPRSERALLDYMRGIEYGVLDVCVEAVMAEERTANLLGVRPGAPLLQREILLRDPSGTPLQLSFGQFRGDRYAMYYSGSIAESGTVKYS